MDPLAVIARVVAAHRREMAGTEGMRLFLALGDSFTAGTGCRHGESWPERLARRIREHSPALELRNLAVEGARSADVLDQLPSALELEPDLVTVVCGANDVLRTTRPDPSAYAAHLEEILTRLRAASPGVRVATATAPEGWDFLALGPRTRRRVERGISTVNEITRRLADEHDVALLEVAGHPGLADPENFSADGLHPSPRGHERAANGFAELLRVRCGIAIPDEGGSR